MQSFNIQSLSALLAQYPPYLQKHELEQRLADALAKNTQKIVVLDDDPTGTQTVHDVCVYTDWSVESITDAFEDSHSMFFILTNSRSFTVEQTIAAHKEIAHNLAAASKKTGVSYLVVSRGDSTLRGHYPLENQVLRTALEAEGAPTLDGDIIFPFFPEGGRYTAGNIHYVADADALTPVGKTEFARDKTFGFSSSDLCDWIEEKSGGEFKSNDVTCITLDCLRALDYSKIEAQLLAVTGFGKVIVNALTYEDVKVFVTALMSVLAKGKHFMFRTAAAFVNVIGGISDQPLLTHFISQKSGRGGLVIAGSHVKKTTAQLDALSTLPDLEMITLDQHLVLDSVAFEAEQQRVLRLCEKAISAGRTTVVMTRRERLDLNTGSKEDELHIATKISDALTGIVSGLSIAPSFLVAKGGITSSDIACKGLLIKKALVAGQIRPGVPVWFTAEESRFPGIPYIIFPGNVGTSEDLKIVVQLLNEQTKT